MFRAGVLIPLALAVAAAAGGSATGWFVAKEEANEVSLPPNSGQELIIVDGFDRGVVPTIPAPVDILIPTEVPH